MKYFLYFNRLTSQASHFRAKSNAVERKIQENEPPKVTIGEVAEVLNTMHEQAASNMERWIKGDLGRADARDPLEALYSFRNGFYRRIGEKELRRLVKALILPQTQWSNHIAEEDMPVQEPARVTARSVGRRTDGCGDGEMPLARTALGRHDRTCSGPPRIVYGIGSSRG